MSNFGWALLRRAVCRSPSSSYTGGAANVTAAHVDDLAMSLRRKAGVDDDVLLARGALAVDLLQQVFEVREGLVAGARRRHRLPLPEGPVKVLY